MRDNLVVHSVTTALPPVSHSVRVRQRRYLITMIARMAAILLAVFAPVPVPIRLLFIALGVVLPYFAVVLANTAQDRKPSEMMLAQTHEIVSGSGRQVLGENADK